MGVDSIRHVSMKINYQDLVSTDVVGNVSTYIVHWGVNGSATNNAYINNSAVFVDSTALYR